MAIDFPATPTSGDTFVAAGITYTFNGYGWAAGGGAAPVDAYTKAESDAMQAQDQLDFVNVTGDTMTGNLAFNMPDASVTCANNMNFEGGARARLVCNGTNFIDVVPTGVAVNAALVQMNAPNVQILAPAGSPRLDWATSATVIQSSILSSATSWGFYSDGTFSVGQYMVPGGSAWVAMSDARLDYKISAMPVGDVLSRLDSVQLYTNTVPISGRVELFFKAQELFASLPEIVDEPTGPEARNADYEPKMGDGNSWGVMYDRAGAVALQAVKELLALNQALTTRIEALETVVAAMPAPTPVKG